MKLQLPKNYLLASDFDQTLSFNDSGLVLSELAGIPAREFEARIAILAIQNFVQQGGELTYLLLHDPDYRAKVRLRHLREAGKRVRLKHNLSRLISLLRDGIAGHRFNFHVITASPQEVVEAALEGIVPPAQIHGTHLEFNAAGEIQSVIRVNAGYGKVAVLDDLQRREGISANRIIYVGDGGSDMHVMLHVNRREGCSIAVTPSRQVAQIARRSVLGDDALGILAPILEEVAGWDASRIRAFFETHGLLIQEWDRVHSDWLTILPHPDLAPETYADGLAPAALEAEGTPHDLAS